MAEAPFDHPDNDPNADSDPNAGIPQTPEEWLQFFADQKAAEEEEEASGGPTSTAIDFTGNSTSVGRFRTDTNRSINETVRRYVDVPTPREFLNDFEVGTNAYLAGLRESGAISQFDMDLARNQMGSLLDDYLGELGLRAARGEDIFEVVGVSNEIQRLGNRPGQQSTTQTSETEKTTGSQTTSGSSSGTSTTNGETSSATDSSTETSRTDNENVRNDTTTRNQTEELFRIDEIANVRKLSPMNFLEGRFENPGELSTVLRSRAGRQRAIEVRGGSGVVSGARRA